ncbi:hypothetical protein MYU51_021423 [Penicillium brevicompactum]|uniref:uncharacterized protein n=1 Tax=Penicillium brevicompactum TaxID=5074 RepID=UPI002541D969|nr:uncharacterized protein N7506_003110 [Penicillium brevicompactum]KAJ5343286.1 hypothetical protein N7506_003110 [Penicillium brevicompactum]
MPVAAEAKPGKAPGMLPRPTEQIDALEPSDSRQPSPLPLPPPTPESENHGFKVLYQGKGPVEVDIVAVHGLNGHRERSWTAANGTNWLRDLLPKDMPSIRVASWGWSLPIAEKSSERTSQQAISEKLIHDLWELRSSTNTIHRPIIFIAHSAGGPIVKSALVYSKSAPTGPTQDLHSIKGSTRGAIFLGSTELGSRLAGLENYLTSAQGSDQESSEVYQEALWLVNTLHRYNVISDGIWTLSVHERPGSSSSETKWDEGNCSHIFSRAGHDDMIKFERFTEEGYLQIKEHLMFVDLNTEFGA